MLTSTSIITCDSSGSKWSPQRPLSELFPSLLRLHSRSQDHDGPKPYAVAIGVLLDRGYHLVVDFIPLLFPNPLQQRKKWRCNRLCLLPNFFCRAGSSPWQCFRLLLEVAEACFLHYRRQASRLSKLEWIRSAGNNCGPSHMFEDHADHT
jgi:hypothetical protein